MDKRINRVEREIRNHILRISGKNIQDLHNGKRTYRELCLDLEKRYPNKPLGAGILYALEGFTKTIKKSIPGEKYFTDFRHFDKDNRIDMFQLALWEHRPSVSSSGDFASLYLPLACTFRYSEEIANINCIVAREPMLEMLQNAGAIRIQNHIYLDSRVSCAYGYTRLYKLR